MIWSPNETAQSPNRAPTEVETRGRNLGEAAAGALAKWAEREQEADILMFRWEASLVEQERSLELYPAALMPTIPEGVELEDLQQPTDPEAQGPDQPDDDDPEPKAHILGNKWRKVRDEAERFFDKRKEQGYYSLAPELRREVMRCHRHLGHMPPDQLARVLADARAKLEVIQWTRRYFECPVCKATIKPGLPRPAAARKTYEFNRTVGADHFTHHFAAQPFDVLNVLCWGTGK